MIDQLLTPPTRRMLAFQFRALKFVSIAMMVMTPLIGLSSLLAEDGPGPHDHWLIPTVFLAGAATYLYSQVGTAWLSRRPLSSPKQES